MSKIRVGGSILLALAVFYLAGCATNASKTDPEPLPTPERTTPQANTSGDTSVPDRVVPQKPRIQDGILELPSSTRGDTAVYTQLGGNFFFDFDEAIVKRAGHSVLNQHASYMASDSAARLRLEGHADERGTREYNLALGERRANAVRAYLTSQGARSSQIEVVSFGEEKPADAGHSESSWAKNRRVELIYQ